MFKRHFLQYLVSLLMQAAGAVLIMRDGMPLYREAVRSPHQMQEPLPNAEWLLVYACLIQAAYWTSRRWNPHGLVGRHPFPGHLVSFMGRMPLLFGTAAFGLLFFARPPGLIISVFDSAVVLTTLFSLYCFNQAMERCSGALSAEYQPGRGA